MSRWPIQSPTLDHTKLQTWAMKPEYVVNVAALGWLNMRTLNMIERDMEDDNSEEDKQGEEGR